MIASQWRNVSTVIISVLLMLFAMVQIVLALALNLRSDQWGTTVNATISQKTRLTTGINLLVDSLFIFPAAWAGICAAVSRHRGVYILLVVITSLAFLGAIGGLVDIAYEFGYLELFSAEGTTNDEMAIALAVMQSLIVLITIGLLIFGIIAILYDCPNHPRRPKQPPMDRPPHYNQPPGFGANPYVSYPQSGYTPAVAAPEPRANTASAYRPLTQGSPEWDRFYEQYFTAGQAGQIYAGDYRKKSSKHRSHSYRM